MSIDERARLSASIRDHADALWQDMKEARRLDMRQTELQLARIVDQIHRVGRDAKTDGLN